MIDDKESTDLEGAAHFEQADAEPEPPPAPSEYLDIYLPPSLQTRIAMLAELAAMHIQTTKTAPASVLRWDELQEKLNEQITKVILEAKS